MDGGVMVDLLLLSSFVSLAKWLLCLKETLPSCSSSSSSSALGMVLGTYGGVFFFFNFLLCDPPMVNKTLAFLGTEGEASSSSFPFGGIFYSSSPSPSCSYSREGIFSTSWAWAVNSSWGYACTIFCYVFWGTCNWVTFLRDFVRALLLSTPLST